MFAFEAQTTREHTARDCALVRLTPSAEPTFRVFCFPYAGSGASVFRAWAAHLPRGVELWGVQPPGRETRFAEDPPTEFGSLVDEATASIRSKLELPYVLFGHSLGALVSFEVVRRLQRHGENLPKRLIVSACAAPQLHRAGTTPVARSQALLESDRRFLRDTLAANGQVREDILDELEDVFLPILRADLNLFRAYCYGHDDPLTVPISVYGGEDDVAVPVAGLEAWAIQTTRACSVRLIPGDHFYLRAQPAELFAALREDMAAVEAA